MAQINANITPSVFPGGPTFPAVAVDWGAAYDAEYTLIEFKLTTENDLVVNTFNIETSSHIYYMYLLKDLPKANTSYKLYLTGILEDGTKDDESTSPAYSFTSPANFGTLDRVVFNDIDNTNYIFQINFAEIVDPYWLDKLQEYKLTVSKDNFSKTIDITNGGYYSLYNICDGNISAGEYTFKIFFTMKSGSEVFTSSEVIKTQNYEKDTRVSLQITGLSISVNETDQQKCTVTYTSESTFDNTLKIYKNNVLKTSIENVTNGFTFYPHDGAYNLDGDTTYSAVLETRRVFPQYNNITETGISNTTTFFLNTWTAPIAPDGLYIDKNLILHWSKIENADEYTVNILNNLYTTIDNYKDLNETFLKDYIGKVEITVTATNGAGSSTSIPFYYTNRPSTVTGIQCLHLDRENKQVIFSWTPQLQYTTEVKYSIYLNNLLLASNLSNASYTFDYTNFFKDGGRYVISVDAIVNNIGTQPMGSLIYTYKEINVEKDAIKKAKIKKTDGSETPEYPISVDAENVIVEYDDGTLENVKVVLEDKAEREFYQDDKISIGHNSSIKQNSYTVAVGQQVVAGGANSIAIGDAAHADGLNSSSFGNGTYANAECSHAEGQGTAVYPEANYSHAEGYATRVSGVAAHAEGSQTNAMTNYSHAEGTETVTSGVAAHAEGIHTVADGEGSHAEGYWTAAYGVNSHAEGESVLNAGGTDHANALKAEGRASHAEGRATIASGNYSHAEGSAGTISGYGQNGVYYTTIVETTASGEGSHAEGIGSKASGTGAHAEGIIDTFTSSSKQTLASGTGAHAEGGATQADGKCSHAEGGYTTTTGKYSHAEGWYGLASGDYAHVEGAGAILYLNPVNGIPNSGAPTYISNIASGKAAHAEGCAVAASGNYSHVGGYRSQATGEYSFAHGNGAVASRAGSVAFGNYPKSTAGEDIFVIGVGNSDSDRKNAMAVSHNTSTGTCNLYLDHGGLTSYTGVNAQTESGVGAFKSLSVCQIFQDAPVGVCNITSGVWGTSAGGGTSYAISVPALISAGRIRALGYDQSGTDYAEYIYPWYDNNENNEDRTGYFVTAKNNLLYKANSIDSILGITSETYGTIGTSEIDGEWKGKYKKDELGRIIIDNNGNRVLNEYYDSSQQYILREYRKEWSAIGLLGQIYVRDDGTCKVGEYCKCANGGIATLAEKQNFNTWLVLERISDNTIKILFK